MNLSKTRSKTVYNALFKTVILSLFFIGGLFIMSELTSEVEVSKENQPLELSTGLTTKAKNKYVNLEVDYKTGLSDIWGIIKAYATTKRAAAAPSTVIPTIEITAEIINNVADGTLFKLGHSSILMKLNQQLLLIDPVFSDRASPVQWAGPKRFHQAPISIDDLPLIDAVIISHDHYDHLDEAAIVQLNNKVERFVVPTTVSKHLIKWGISRDKIVELDWWKSASFEGVELTATPTQHFSGRGLFDRDETLWASWVIRTDSLNIFFSGDSGYFSGFKKIGQQYGPFDLTMIETGAYNELWSEIHMLPKESLQAHIDLQGKVMMPVHNGTFDLALHDWYEPLEKITRLAELNSVTLSTPIFGQPINMKTPKQTQAWWRKLM